MSEYKNKIVAITGAAGGIGEAIARAFIAQGAKVAISDVDLPRSQATAENIGATAYYCDVGDETSMDQFIQDVKTSLGPIDIFVSNAGIGLGDVPGSHAASGSNKSWEASWQVNTMANVYAARALLPDWIARGEGRMVIVASAAGLLAQVGSASYTVTKHAAVGYAEYLAIMHRADGVRVHCVCPQYVKTNMTEGIDLADPHQLLEPEDVANSLLTAIDNEEFLVLPHEIVGKFYAAKAQNTDYYIQNMSDNMDKLHNPLAPKPKTADKKA